MPSLCFFRGEDPVVEFRLRPGPNTIGRADTCDVALPGESISRTHCIVQGQGDAWEVVDRSRHGVTIDGQPVSRRAALPDGSVLGVGPYRVRFTLGSTESRPTAPQEPDRSHEVILAADGVVTVERAVLVVVNGPGAGRRLTLVHTRATVGAGGSTLLVEGPGVVADHCWLRVARGRVMVEPGKGATWLDGQRIRDVTPLLPDEEFRIGGVALRVERGEDHETPLARRFGDMVGESRVMNRLFGTLRRMAGHHYTVLVVGESGTGKELVARGIHEHSPRADRRLVTLNCGAITESLFESELFGHEKGAFTGADRQKDGAFHHADGGTLFLDEVGELPEAAQAKLLRALETGEVRRVGSTEVSYPDVRVVAATNRDLARDVGKGRFREDLFFRLAVLTVPVPALRDRPTDIEPLCKHLCGALHPEARVTPDALEVLLRHSWPGNVRELRNVLTRAYVLGGPRIDVSSITFHQIGAPETALAVDAGSLDEAEKAYLLTVLQRHGENRSSAARELGIARSTLHYKLRKHGLS